MTTERLKPAISVLQDKLERSRSWLNHYKVRYETDKKSLAETSQDIIKTEWEISSIEVAIRNLECME